MVLRPSIGWSTWKFWGGLRAAFVCFNVLSHLDYEDWEDIFRKEIYYSCNQATEATLDEFELVFWKNQISTSKTIHINRWIPPAEGWTMINVDAAIRERINVLLWWWGTVWVSFSFWQARNISSLSPEKAKIKALPCASEIAIKKGWNQVEWRCQQHVGLDCFLWRSMLAGMPDMSFWCLRGDFQISLGISGGLQGNLTRVIMLQKFSLKDHQDFLFDVLSVEAMAHAFI